MIVQAKNMEWIIHSTKMRPAGNSVGLWVDPYGSIHIMKKVTC